MTAAAAIDRPGELVCDGLAMFFALAALSMTMAVRDRGVLLGLTALNIGLFVVVADGRSTSAVVEVLRVVVMCCNVVAPLRCLVNHR